MIPPLHTYTVTVQHIVKFHSTRQVYYYMFFKCSPSRELEVRGARKTNWPLSFLNSHRKEERTSSR